MNYDTENEKNNEKKFSEKLKLARSFFADKNLVDQVYDLIAKLTPFVEGMSIRINSGEKISDEEMSVLKYSDDVLKNALQSVSDMKLILNASLISGADAIFYHIKQLAENGNEEAKKAYEDLLPGYRESLKERTQSDEMRN